MLCNYTTKKILFYWILSEIEKMTEKTKNPHLVRFGNHLGELKKQSKLSYRKIAERCDNLDHADIQRYVEGKINPTLLSLLDLAKGLGISPKSLLDYESDDSREY